MLPNIVEAMTERVLQEALVKGEARGYLAKAETINEERCVKMLSTGAANKIAAPALLGT